jgi:hypothetical protein
VNYRCFVLCALSFLTVVFLFPCASGQEMDVVFGANAGIVICGGRMYDYTQYKYISHTYAPWSVYVLDVKTGSQRVAWKNDIPFRNPGLSRSNTLLGIIECNASSGTHDLKIATLEGRERKKIVGVHKFVWSPHDERLAYISGEDREEGLEFASTGIWVYDPATDTTKKVYSAGYDLSWAEFDGNLYIWQCTDGPTKVFRYDPRKETTTGTPYAGVYFSPDGKYYFHMTTEGGPFRLFLREGDQEITKRFAFLALPSKENIFPRQWLDNHTLAIPSHKTNDERDYVLDVEKDVVKRASGQIIALIGDTQELLLLKEGRVVKEKVSDLEPVNLENP